MNSKEMNDKIYELDNNNNDNPIYESVLGEKLIPYIGWFWREVDFDDYPYSLGVIPDGAIKDSLFEKANDRNLVGFMENNKWDYPYINTTIEQSKEIRKLIEVALKDPTKDNFKKVDGVIQSIGKDVTYKITTKEIGNSSYQEYTEKNKK